jgi:hypothetical protein
MGVSGTCINSPLEIDCQNFKIHNLPIFNVAGVNNFFYPHPKAVHYRPVCVK